MQRRQRQQRAAAVVNTSPDPSASVSQPSPPPPRQEAAVRASEESGSSVRGHQYRDMHKMISFQLLLVVAALCYSYASVSNEIREAGIPIVVNTWDFENATRTGEDFLCTDI